MAEMEGTDLTKWKLQVDRGRQVWHYNPDQSAEEQKMYDRYFLGLDIVRNIAIEGRKVTTTIRPNFAIDFSRLSAYFTDPE